MSPRLLGGAVVTAVMPSLVAALLPLASLSALVLLPGSSWDIDEACFPSTAWERRVARLVREDRQVQLSSFLICTFVLLCLGLRTFLGTPMFGYFSNQAERHLAPGFGPLGVNYGEGFFTWES